MSFLVVKLRMFLKLCCLSPWVDFPAHFFPEPYSDMTGFPEILSHSSLGSVPGGEELCLKEGRTISWWQALESAALDSVSTSIGTCSSCAISPSRWSQQARNNRQPALWEHLEQTRHAGKQTRVLTSLKCQCH